MSQFTSLTFLILCFAAPIHSQTGSTQLKATEPTADTQLQQLVEAYFDEMLALNPIVGTYIGESRFDGAFVNNLTPEHRRLRQELNKRYLESLSQIPTSQLSRSGLLTYEIFRFDRLSNLKGESFPYHLVPLNQFSGMHNTFAGLGSGEGPQPFKTPANFDNFLKRIDGMVEWLSTAQANMREGMAKGIVLPRIIMEKVIPQLEAHLVTRFEDSLFYQPIAKMPVEISGSERERIISAYRTAIMDKLLPAYRGMRDFIQKEYLPKCRTTAGLGGLPGGEAWYQYEAESSTTTKLSADEIHKIGLAEVARIEAEMNRVREDVQFQGDLRAFFKHLQTDPKFYFENKQDLVDGYIALKSKIDQLLPKYFDIKPKNDYEVRPVEAYREASAAGASYEPGTPDGSRAGIFYINTFDLKSQPKFGMETLSLHEAAPGHHFQIAIQQELTNLPRFRRFGGYTSFDEGWALYAEYIGKELGLFTDPYQWYGRLSDEMLRAMRLVVDTGLHAKGWTREQAIQFMRDHSSMNESDIIAEVERYMVIPGQALAYKIGQLKIVELRQKAEKELGKKFDLKAFHREVLIDGAVPLDVLAAKIERWIAARK